MKKALLILSLLTCTQVFAQSRFGGCGFAPIAPIGKAFICLCDSNGGNCRFMTVPN